MRQFFCASAPCILRRKAGGGPEAPHPATSLRGRQELCSPSTYLPTYLPELGPTPGQQQLDRRTLIILEPFAELCDVTNIGVTGRVDSFPYTAMHHIKITVPESLAVLPSPWRPASEQAPGSPGLRPIRVHNSNSYLIAHHRTDSGTQARFFINQ